MNFNLDDEILRFQIEFIESDLEKLRYIYVFMAFNVQIFFKGGETRDGYNILVYKMS
jgi:hypothetical protein